jgi:ribosomal protein L11 methyltransferase
MNKKYICARFETSDPSTIDLLIGLLSMSGFDGFQEEEQSLSAFINAEDFDEIDFNKKIELIDVKYSLSDIYEENWNQLWESSFTPVLIPGKVAVRADFHAPVEDVVHEIIITPKMSFGTGHHATTWLMMEEMMNTDFRNKSVLDFGTGTGILAILAEKCGASSIEAIDNDEWSLTNAAENIVNNQCRHINLYCAEAVPAGRQVDIILANINRNVLLDNREMLEAALSAGGTLFLSGLLSSDKEDMVVAFSKFFGSPAIFKERNNWILLAFKR